MRNILGALAVLAIVSSGFSVDANAMTIVEGSYVGGNDGGTVAAVPEADTWAMMAVGLGLVGLRLRRKNKSDKHKNDDK